MALKASKGALMETKRPGRHVGCRDAQELGEQPTYSRTTGEMNSVQNMTINQLIKCTQLGKELRKKTHLAAFTVGPKKGEH